MKNNYIKKLIVMFPDIASGRKNIFLYVKRIQKNIALTKKYIRTKKDSG